MRARTAVAALLVLPLLGCSISASSWSSYKSSRSSSHSSDSSSASSPGAAEEAYREDVSDYTRAYARSGGKDFRAFQADLARIAAEHGISDWERNPVTYGAIGEGLGRAKASDVELMAYERTLAGGDAAKTEAMQKGYDSAR